MVSLRSVFSDKIHTYRLFHAIEDDDLTGVTKILKKHPRVVNLPRSKADATTPLMMAAAFGRTDIVKKLLQQGAHVDAQGYLCRTALHYAVQNQNRIMPRERTDNHRETIKLLLKHNANINHIDAAGHSVLDRCITTKNIEFAQFLIAHGADVEHQNAQGQSVLMRAAMALCSSMVTLLIGHDAKIDTRDKNGHSAAELAGQCNSFLKAEQTAIIRTLNAGLVTQTARANFMRDIAVQKTSYEGVTEKPVLQKRIRLKNAP